MTAALKRILGNMKGYHRISDLGFNKSVRFTLCISSVGLVGV